MKAEVLRRVKAMGTDSIIASQGDSHRYEAVLRISEAIAACREPEELARTLADEIGKLLHFDHLYFVVVKQNSKEIELGVGRALSAIQGMGKNNWPRFRSPHTLDYAASSIGCFRNQPRHGESIQRRRNKLPVADRACRRLRAG